MILDVIVCSPGEILGDLGPAIAELLVGLNDKHVFILSPLVLLDIRVQVIVPSINI
jgi:hypothetical protein